MTLEFFLLIVFGVLIILQSFIMYVMYVRIRQLLRLCDRSLDDQEIDAIISTIDQFKNLKLE